MGDDTDSEEDDEVSDGGSWEPNKNGGGKVWVSKEERELEQLFWTDEQKVEYRERKFHVSEEVSKDKAAKSVYGHMETGLFDSDFKTFRPLGVGYSLYFKFLVSRLQVQQFTQIYTITDCCLALSALGS